MRQIETSRTLVFDAPRRARAFTEALIADNLDIGRPDSVELIFTGRGPGAKGRPIKNDTICKTKVVTVDTEVSMNAFFKFKHCQPSRTVRILASLTVRTKKVVLVGTVTVWSSAW